LIWVILFHRLIRRLSMTNLLATISFQLWLLNAAAVLLMPDRVLFPQFSLPLGYITERLSLAAGVMMCGVLAASPLTRFSRIALVSVTALFFVLLYTDHRELNQMEDRLKATLNRLAAGERVVNSLSSKSLRSLCLQHQLDRECIGRCLSYANYEPSSRQFRIRAVAGNGIVLDDYADVDAVAHGSYLVQPKDLPISLVYLCGADSRAVCVRSLAAGESAGNRN